MPERIHFGKIKEASEPPNLIEVQLNSYVDFLQRDVPASKRKVSGLQAVFKEVFPIESYDDKATLDFLSLRDRRAQAERPRSPARRPDFFRPAARHLPAQGRKRHQGRKGLHGRNPAHDPAGHVCHQRRGTCRGVAVAPLARHRLREQRASQRQGSLLVPDHS